MKREAVDEQLLQGKEAARRGDSVLALRLLQAVVEVEPTNEQAWLWLSAVVDSEADRRLCLDNVLVLNPDNEAAKRGLQRLVKEGEGAPFEEGELVERRSAPVTPAAAILYPERQEKVWRWHDPIELQQATIAGFSAESSFNDVWQGDDDLCAYCATELAAGDSRCPGCGRRLLVTAFRYPKASSDLMIYWVLILGIGEIALGVVIVKLLSHGSPATLAWQTLVFGAMVLLAAGLAFRRFWAYSGSIVALLMVLTAMILGSSLGPAVDDTLSQLTGQEFFLLLGERPVTLFVEPVNDLLRILHYLVVPLALLFALFRVGPDFERVSERQVAQLKRGLSDASRYHGVGADYAGRGMWASAVLHFQRAAALEPANAFYQRQLGDAYSHLGHYQRSLDVLESAQRLARDPGSRAKIDQMIAEVRAQR